MCGFVVGYGAVIVKNGLRICGSGAALANSPVQQNKAYFEAKLQSSGGAQYLYLHTIAHDMPRAGPKLVHYVFCFFICAEFLLICSTAI